jgi:hypothetical protein
MIIGRFRATRGRTVATTITRVRHERRSATMASETRALPTSEGAVRLVVVVVALVCAQRCYGISQVDDQNAVEEFATDAAAEAFSDRVGSRRPHRRPDDPDIDGSRLGSN